MIYDLEIRFTDEKDNKYAFWFGTHYKKNNEKLNRAIPLSEEELVATRVEISKLILKLFPHEPDISDKEGVK